MSTTKPIHANAELNEWQVAEMRVALCEADAGDFASDEEVEAVASRWGVDGLRMFSRGTDRTR